MHECLARFDNLTLKDQEEGGCPVFFDSWKCWRAARPGETVSQPCPDFPHLGFTSDSEFVV